MTDEHMLIDELLSVARGHSDLPPYEKATLQLSLGQISMVAKGLELLAAVRAAQLNK